MKQIFAVDVVRKAYATVLVKAETEEQARKLAYSRAHETVGIEDYSYGDFELN